jgi:hypothetical protein
MSGLAFNLIPEDNMNSSDYKHYTLRARIGIKGESFFETLISEYCIPHHITGPKDIGIDYICEWVHNEKPSGILFAVQVKTSAKKAVQIIPDNTGNALNNLCQYEIKDIDFKITKADLCYWKGLGIPFYLFVMIEQENSDRTKKLDCYYKRFTPILTRELARNKSINFKKEFYQVNKGSSFIAFSDKEKRKGGFARDLFIDHVRCCYHKGTIALFNPRLMGLEEFPPKAVYEDLFDSYKNQICSVYEETKRFLKSIGYKNGQT